jgi:hypothetical protein
MWPSVQVNCKIGKSVELRAFNRMEELLNLVYPKFDFEEYIRHDLGVLLDSKRTDGSSNDLVLNPCLVKTTFCVQNQTLSVSST